MKKIISFVVCLSLLLGSSATVFAAGEGLDDAVLISEHLPVQPTMGQVVFTGTPASLTLDAVITYVFTTGTAIEIAEINKKSDYAIAMGHSDTYTTVQNALDLLSSISLSSASALGIDVSGIDAKVARLTRDFARDNLESNYQAELNSIEKDAVELYYNTLSAQEYYEVAKEDLAAKKLTASNVQKKYNLGAAARIDLQTAQNAVTEANSALAGASASYNSAKMNFNMQMGYPLMQEIILSEELKACTLPAVNLDKAVESALEARNEIKGTEFAFELQKLIYENSKLTKSQASSAFKKGEVSYLNAKRQADQIRPLMQMDVLVKYMALIQKQMAATAAESTVALSKEAYRIAQLTYNAGMSTFADLQDSEVRYNQAKLGRISAVTDLALAVYDFEYATAEGTFRVALGG